MAEKEQAGRGRLGGGWLGFARPRGAAARYAVLAALAVLLGACGGCSLFRGTQADEKPAGPPPVTRIKLAVTAQRAESFAAQPRTWTVAEGDVLQAGDRFSISLTPDADSWVCIFLHDPEGKISVLFPTRDFEEQFQKQFGRPFKSQVNYCRAGWDYRVPGADEADVEHFFVLGGVAGRNILYVAARRGPQADVQDLRLRLSRAASPEQRLDMLRREFEYVQVLELNQK